MENERQISLESIRKRQELGFRLQIWVSGFGFSLFGFGLRFCHLTSKL